MPGLARLPREHVVRCPEHLVQDVHLPVHLAQELHFLGRLAQRVDVHFPAHLAQAARFRARWAPPGQPARSAPGRTQPREPSARCPQEARRLPILALQWRVPALRGRCARLARATSKPLVLASLSRWAAVPQIRVPRRQLVPPE